MPVAVRSTIASTSPVSGASSTEPLTSTISAWRPVSLEVRGGDPRVLRRDAHDAEPAQRLGGRVGLAVDAWRGPSRQRAEAEVEQLVDLALALLDQDVLAGDADVGGAGLDVGRHVATGAS